MLQRNEGTVEMMGPIENLDFFSMTELEKSHNTYNKTSSRKFHADDNRTIQIEAQRRSTYEFPS